MTSPFTDSNLFILFWPPHPDIQHKCTKGWAFERVLGFELKGKERKRIQVTNRLSCMQACLSERDFECRSSNYDTETGDCSLSDLDRASIVPTHDMKMRTYGPSSAGSVEYIENNCLEGKCYHELQTTTGGGEGQTSKAPSADGYLQ